MITSPPNSSSIEVLQPETDNTAFSPFNEALIEREFEQSTTNPFSFSSPEPDQDEQEQEDYEDVPEWTPTPEPTPEAETKPLFNPKLAQVTSATVIAILERMLPKIAYHFAELDVTPLEGLDLAKGTVERLEQINANNKEALEDSVSDNIQLLAEPMKLVMETRNLNVSPETTLVFTLVFVLANIGMDTMKMRKRNEQLIAQIIALNTKKVEEKTPTSEKPKEKSESNNVKESESTTTNDQPSN